MIELDLSESAAVAREVGYRVENGMNFDYNTMIVEAGDGENIVTRIGREA